MSFVDGKPRCLTLALVAAVLLGSAGMAGAGEIDDVDLVTGDGLGFFSGGLLNFFSEDNDESHLPLNPLAFAEAVFEGRLDVDDRNINSILLFKGFEEVAPIDTNFIVLNTEDSGRSVTEYFFFELVINGTGVPWTDYHFELGYLDEIDDDQFEFLPLEGGGPLDFDRRDPAVPQPPAADRDPTPTSSTIQITEVDFDPDDAPFKIDVEFTPLFTDLTHMNDGIWWDVGELPPLDQDLFDDIASAEGPVDLEELGGALSDLDADELEALLASTGFFTFSIDIPDVNPTTPDAFNFGEGYSFALRQYPTIADEDPVSDPAATVVPEPSTLALLGLGVAGLARRRRKRS